MSNIVEMVWLACREITMSNLAQLICCLNLGNAVFILWLVLAFSIFLYTFARPPVYLLDYSCVKYDDEHKTNLEVLQYFLEQYETLGARDKTFHLKVFLKSGIGEEAYVPRANLLKGRLVSLEDFHEQTHVLVVGAAQKVLKQTGIKGEEVDMVIVNSGTFNPTPSMTALLVNYFKMRSDVKTIQLGGMGCSAGLIAVDLAKDLLRLHKNKYALVVSTEVLPALYDGKERSMMVTNCLFRCAGSAVLLSNRKSDKRRAKLELLQCIRINTAAKDEAHNCVVIKEDEEGVSGAQLSVKLIEVAGNALRANIQRLAPKVLPTSELWKAACNEVRRKLLKPRVIKEYVPNFKKAFKHFCIHPGGKTVIEGVGKSLSLSNYDLEPSLMALHRFGNTSSAGVWYILAYCEAKGRLKAGDKVWQIGLGSGFKCTTAVWRVLKDLIQPACLSEDTAWGDCVHRYPVGDLKDCPHVLHFIKFIRTKFEY